jgi:ketosteroid isomerase-like protein
MKSYFSTHIAGRGIKTAVSLFLGAALFLACASPAAAQKKKKTDAPADSMPSIPMSDEKQVDYTISEMLGAWQLGDIDKLHKDYADDVSIVSGSWAPPIFTWAAYLPIYQQQRNRMQQVRMDRTNTYIKLNGNFAWACYQWEFSALVDGQPSTARGQTTLILEKRNDHWVIVHNHTSLAPSAQPVAPASTPPTTQPPANSSSAQ